MSDNISIVQGESRILNVTANDENGDPIDLTNSSIVWIAALNPYGTPVITKPGVLTNPPGTDGKFKVTLTALDTSTLIGNLYHSATMTFLDGSVTTAFLGLISISPLNDMSSVEEFKIRYPEFTTVSNALISLTLEDAALEVDDGWNLNDISRARMLWAAHRLTLQGEPARSSSGVSIALTGPVKSHKVGDVSIEFAGSGSSGGTGGDFESTLYGREYLRLLFLNFGGVRVLTGPNCFP